MKKDEETQKRTYAPNEDRPCCEPDERKRCCPDQGETKSASGCGEGIAKGMDKCFSKCRYLPLVPIVLGSAFILLGYLLTPAVIRVLWMVGAGLVVAMGLFGLIIAQRIVVKVSQSGCC